MSEKPIISSVFDGRYQIEKLIGQGGMGAVYLAHDPLLNIAVAVKTVDVNFDRPEALVRFQNEAITTGKLAHPNVARTLNFGLIESSPYMVMEYVEGDSLAAILRREGRLDVGRALPIFVDICAGLRHAHEQGILHRDLKPSNVIITKGSENRVQAKIVDFGIAKVKDSDFRITDSNSFVGSPLYVSPEQAKNMEVDERSDVYSFGCLMFETLTGEPPIAADQAIDTIQKKCTVDAPSLMAFEEYAFPEALALAVDTCIKRKKEDRYPNITAVQAAIEAAGIEPDNSTIELQQEEKKEIGRKRPVAIFSLVVCAIGLCVFLIPVLYKTWSSQPDSKLKPFDGPNLLVSPSEIATNELGESGPTRQQNVEHLEPVVINENEAERAVKPEVDNAEETEREQEFKELDKLSFFHQPGQAIQINPANSARADIGRWSNDKDLIALKGRKDIRYLYLLNCGFVEGSGLKYAEDLPLSNFCSVRTPLNDDSMRSVGKMNGLNFLMIVDAPITDRGLSYLEKLDNLKSIEITSNYVTDLGVAHLAKLKRLNYCALVKCAKVTDACIPYLNKMPCLNDLDLSYSSVTDKGLFEILSGNEKIFCVSANGLSLSDATFDAILARPLRKLRLLDSATLTNRHLARISEQSLLEHLACDCRNVDSRGIGPLRKLKHLRSIHLQNLVCDKSVMQQLLTMDRLERITLDHCQIYDEQLPGFAGLKNLSVLEIINVDNTKVSSSGMEILKKGFRKLNGRDINLEMHENQFVD